MKLRSILACMSAAGVASVHAQETLQLAQAYDAKMGQEIVVTATRSPQELKDTLASATVISRDQIENSQAQDLYQLLKAVAGVNIRRSGGRSSQTSLTIRGGDVSGTMVLVDGVNIESATLGQAEIEQLDLDQIERIEILRGPKSSLYGSQAMFGVVQIFTRKSAGKNGVTYSGGLGSDQTREASISANGSSETSRYNVTASYAEADGFDAQSEDDGISGIDRFDYDNDGYRRNGLSINVEQDFGDYLSANGIFSKHEGKTEYDVTESSFASLRGQTLPYSNTESENSTLSLAFDTEQLHSRLQYGVVDNFSENHNDFAPKEASTFTEIETLRQSGLWENSLSLVDWLTLNFGADYVHEEVNSLSGYSEDRRDVFGGYANTQMKAGDLSWSLGMRHDDHENLGSKWTGDTAFGWEFVDGITAMMSYGTGYKAPSFNDLFWPASPWSAGNPNLLPEETETYEIGIDAYQNWGMASFHVYKTYVDNLIEWAEVSPFFWTPSNVSSVKIRGAEMQYGTEQLGVKWLASFTYQKVSDVALDQDLDRRPRRQLALDADKQLGKFSVGGTWYAQSGFYDGVDDNGDRASAAGYGQLDIRASYMATPELKLRARVDNLFDQDFEENVGFNNPGLFYLIGFDYTPR